MNSRVTDKIDIGVESKPAEAAAPSRGNLLKVTLLYTLEYFCFYNTFCKSIKQR